MVCLLSLDTAGGYTLLFWAQSVMDLYHCTAQPLYKPIHVPTVRFSGLHVAIPLVGITTACHNPYKAQPPYQENLLREVSSKTGWLRAASIKSFREASAARLKFCRRAVPRAP